MIAPTPNPPYYAVIFTSFKSNMDEGYTEMALKMAQLAQQQPGYLGHESARDGIGITVSYWQNIAAIKQWKQQSDHLFAQQKGREQWYSQYKIRICKVEMDYDFHKD